MAYVVLVFAAVLVSGNTNLLRNYHFNSNEFIESINTQAKTWKAGRNFMEDVPDSYIRGLMGVYPELAPGVAVKTLHPNQSIPREFDARQRWPRCTMIRKIRDQGSCGSCWAVAAVAAMSDRICIHSNGKSKVHLSSENLMTCCKGKGCKGCEGGTAGVAWKYWVQRGIVSGGPYGSNQGCQPYKIKPCDHHVDAHRGSCHRRSSTPRCARRCKPGYTRPYRKDLFYGNESYYLNNDMKEIQLEIFKNGPVEASFKVYEDFLHYKSGVYQHTTGSKLGNHAVKILGWGVEDDIPYWLVANSWNSHWGIKGFFKILRGNDHCGLEQYVTAGIPDGVIRSSAFGVDSYKTIVVSLLACFYTYKNFCS